MRVIVMTITIVSWSGLALAVASLAVVPALGLLPLVVLAAGFEVVFAAHVGVERVGRFLRRATSRLAGCRGGSTPPWRSAGTPA